MPAWLELPPSQGARRFGPLPDTVRIGGDPSACDIVLAARIDAPPVAAELVRQTDRTWRVALPGEVPHPCRITGDGPPRRVAATDVLRSGETLEITGARTTARFTLRASPDPLPPPRSSDADGPSDTPPSSPVVAAVGRTPGGPVVAAVTRPTATPRPTPPSVTAPAPTDGSSLADEVRRQAGARLVARVPGLRALQDGLRRYGDGRWASPTVLVGALLAVAASAALCGLGGLALVLSAR